LDSVEHFVDYYPNDVFEPMYQVENEFFEIVDKFDEDVLAHNRTNTILYYIVHNASIVGTNDETFSHV
jgi:hypothetical protein